MFCCTLGQIVYHMLSLVEILAAAKMAADIAGDPALHTKNFYAQKGASACRRRSTLKTEYFTPFRVLGFCRRRSTLCEAPQKTGAL